MSLVYKNKKFIDEGIDDCDVCICHNMPSDFSMESFLTQIEYSRYVECSGCLRSLICYLFKNNKAEVAKKLLKFDFVPLRDCSNEYYKNYKEFFDIINKKKGLEIE